MGDIAAQHLCDQWLKEFGDEVLPEVRLEADCILCQGLVVTDEFEVRLSVTIWTRNLDEVSLYGDEVLFSHHQDETDALNYLWERLHGNEEDEEEFAKLKRRMDKVFNA